MAIKIINPAMPSYQGKIIDVNSLPSENIKANTVYRLTEGSDVSYWLYDGEWSKFGSTPQVQEIKITENGTYNTNTAGSSVDGYNPIIVEADVVLPTQQKTKTLTENGVTEIAADKGYTLSKVSITTNIENYKPEEEKTINITSNGTNVITPSAGSVLTKVTATTNVVRPLQAKTVTTNGTITPDSGYYGLSSVSVNVQPALQEKTIDENGEITADSGYYGLSEVTVNLDATPYIIPFLEGNTSGEFVIPNTVSTIASYAICGQGYSSINIPAKVTSIQSNAFVNCNNLRDIIYEGTIDQWLSNVELADGWTDVADISVVCSDGAINRDIIYNLNADSTAYNVTRVNNAELARCEIIDVINGLPVTTITQGAFTNSEVITSVHVPVTVNNIVAGAFANCDNLDNIHYLGTLEQWNNITKEENWTDEARNIIYISGVVDKSGIIYTLNAPVVTYNLDNNESSIEDLSYSILDATACKDTRIEVLETINSLPITGILSNAFGNMTTLHELVVPDTITTIEQSALCGCSSLESLTIPFVGESIQTDDNITYPQYTFGYIFGTTAYDGGTRTVQNYYTASDTSSTGYYYIPDSLRSVAVTGGNIIRYAFANCINITNITIGTSCESINTCAFSGCKGLNNFTIPDSVTYINSDAFRYCANLSSITIGNGITQIGSNAWDGCDSLQAVYINDLAAWCKINFKYATANPLYYNSDLYLNESLITDLVIPDNIISINQNAFVNYKRLNSITIPASTTSINVSAFAGCSSLDNIIVSDENTAYYSEGNCLIRTSDKNLILGCNKSLIPDGVKAIGVNAFSGRTELMSVIIPNSVTDIYDNAFYECTQLSDLTIGTNVVSIGANAFTNCHNLASIKYNAKAAKDKYTSDTPSFKNIGTDCTKTEVIVGANVTKIPSKLFYDARHITNIIFEEESVCASIGDWAFNNCYKLKTITIPASITSISGYTFNGCYGLVEVINKSALAITKGSSTCGYVAYYALSVHSGESIINTYNDYLFIQSDDGSNYLIGYIGNETSLVLPDKYNEQQYKIYKQAFRDCRSLISVIIPDSIQSIGDGVFSGCSNLESLTLPFIGESIKTSTDTYQYPFGYIFGGNSYTGGVSTAQRYYGSNTSSTTSTAYYIPESLKSVTITGGNILYGAFSNCTGLTGITIGSNVQSIISEAFIGCTDLTNFTVNESNPTYHSLDNCIINTETNILIAGCSTSIIPDYVVGIGDYAFNARVGLNTIYIPSSVTSIGVNAFQGCTGLTDVIIPDSVTSIGLNAFYQCSGLISITIPFIGSEKDSTSNQHFGYIFGASSYSSNDSYVPSSLQTVVVAGGTSIGNYAFRNCTGLTSITIPDSVTSIGSYAFYGCTGLTNITFPDSLTSFGSSAFYNCSNLTDIVIGDNVTSIGSYAFYMCKNVKTINYNAKSVTNLAYGNYAFSYVGNNVGTTVIIGANVTSIPDNLFFPYNSSSYRPNITSVVFEEGSQCASIGAYAFYYCNACRVFDFSALTAIPTLNGSYVFDQTSSSKKIIVPDDLYDSWKTTTNWSEYASNIIKLSNYVCTVDALAHGTSTLSISENNECIATATPDTGYAFSGWYRNASVIDVDRQDIAATPISGASYGFTLNSNGYYESQNKGRANSYAICRFNFTAQADDILRIEYINSGQSSYDYGIIGNLDTALTLSYLADSSYYKSFSGQSSTSVKTLTMTGIPAGDHFIDAKFRKNNSTNSGNDSLQIKITKMHRTYEFTDLASTDNPYVVCDIDDYVPGSDPVVLYAKFDEVTTEE